MWVSHYNRWSPKANAFEKFAVERIIQRCDFAEIINNKHRTTNGYIQVKELIRLSELSIKRGRTIWTLIKLLEEAVSPYIKQNIHNDLIIKKYFSDLKEYIEKLDPKELIEDSSSPNLTALNRFIYKLKLFEIQLSANYYELLKIELLHINIDDETQFERNADIIAEIIDILVSFLIFQGYSISSITGLILKWQKSDYHISLSKLLKIFDFENREYIFYILVKDGEKEMIDFAQLLSNESFVNDVTVVKAEELGERFISRFKIGKKQNLVKYLCKTFDPNNHIRSAYDRLLKKLVGQKERQSLAAFNNFFDNCYWQSSHKSTNTISKIKIDGDAIDINSRDHTLRKTLKKYLVANGIPFDEDGLIPITDHEQLNNAIFYYNLGIGSKSIENSMSVIWTALESILPYRTSSSDVECVQNFIANSLGLGCFARDVHAFGFRFIQSNQQNGNILDDCETRNFASLYSDNGIREWYAWLTDPTIAKENFQKVKACSELLAYEYSKIGKSYSLGNSEYLFKKLLSSSESAKFQIQRIYIHRNQIVHAGDFINEYTNLWMNLEWYTGKMLAYFLINLYYQKNFKTLEEAARKLDSDYNYLLSYLTKNKSKKISDLPERITKIIFNQSWQSF